MYIGLRRGYAGKRLGARICIVFLMVLSGRKELKTWVAVSSLTLLATAAWADPQSEISAYRKSYGLPAVTADAKLNELARQQANAMAERRSMGHNVYNGVTHV
jgi:hypothetical protein